VITEDFAVVVGSSAFTKFGRRRCWSSPLQSIRGLIYLLTYLLKIRSFSVYFESLAATYNRRLSNE